MELVKNHFVEATPKSRKYTRATVIVMFVLITVCIAFARDVIAQVKQSYSDRLSLEVEQAKILSTQLNAAANLVDNKHWIGTMYNEVDLKEHTCYSIGLLLGQPASVRHIRLNRSPPLKATDSEEAHELRIIAQSLDNFVGAAKYVKHLTPHERSATWNLDCVGHLGIKGVPVATEDRATFYRLKNDGQVLQILGDIEQGFAARLRTLIEDNPKVTTVALGSGGGYVNEAIEAGRYIRARGLKTTLWNNCFSACPLVFIGGVERLVWSPYPQLGFHKFYTPSGAIPPTSSVYREVAVYVREALIYSVKPHCSYPSLLR